MSETEVTELASVARLSRTANGVAGRSDRALRLLARSGLHLGLLVVPATAARLPAENDGKPSGLESGSTDVSGREDGPPRGATNLGGISDPKPDVAAWQGLPGAEGVIIIDDCTLFRENLAAILAVRGIAVAGTAWDLPSLVAAFDETNPNLVLLNMATQDSHLLIQAALDISPGARIIAVGVADEDQQKIVACAELGVAGYHMRSDSLDDLIMVVHKVARGESIYPPRVSAVLLRRLSNLASQRQPPGRGLVLTAREAQILKMLELGRSNSDIAARLDIAVHTVKNHVHNLLTKLGVSTRAEAAALSRAISSERAANKN